MASLWKHPHSPFRVACFTIHGAAGEILRRKKSLRTRDRKLASRIADALEEVGRGAMDENSIIAFVEKIPDLRARRAAQVAFAETFRLATGRDMGAGSLRSFAQSWLDTMRPQIAPTSYLKYERAIDDFLAFIGKAADRELIGFGNRDDRLVVGFRDHLAARLAPSSANDALKIVRQMFNAARERFKIENPAALVRGIKKSADGADRRRAFTIPEVGRILRAAKGGEWEGIILFGLYTGQRLSDIARLRWENVDVVRGELALTTRKTRRRVLVPLAEPVMEYLLEIPAADRGVDFIFPNAAAYLDRTRAGTVGGLSNQFREILARAGLVRRRPHRKAEDGLGRSARRKGTEISFHSLRHSATSLMKNAGVPQSVVMDIIGHESKAVSQIYTHTGDEDRRRAIEKLPSLQRLLEAATESEPQSQRRRKRAAKDGEKRE